MATHATDNKEFTKIPNGDDCRLAFVPGGSAGALTVDSSFGIAAGTVLEQVIKLVLSGVLVKSATDLSSEFVSPVVTANQIDNTSGTTTAGSIVVVKYRKYSLVDLLY
jgi:hypothetical protein